MDTKAEAQRKPLQPTAHSLGEPLAVEVGDTVYRFDDENDCLDAFPVVAKYQGYGYALVAMKVSRPYLLPVEEGTFYPDARSAVEGNRTDIESSCEYYTQRLDSIKAVLAEGGSDLEDE